MSHIRPPAKGDQRRADSTRVERWKTFVPCLCGQRCGRCNFEYAHRPARLPFQPIAHSLNIVFLLLRRRLTRVAKRPCNGLQIRVAHRLMIRQAGRAQKQESYVWAHAGFLMAAATAPHPAKVRAVRRVRKQASSLAFRLKLSLSIQTSFLTMRLVVLHDCLAQCAQSPIQCSAAEREVGD